MKVTLFHCGPAANESELIAFKHLENRLQSTFGEDEWILLTNLAFSVTQRLQSDEIDIVAIGPPGIRVIEVKHWTAQWVDTHMQDLVVHEAERVTEKARKIGTTLRRTVQNLPRVDASILLTQEASKVKRFAGTGVRGVNLYSLNEWKESVGLDLPARLSPQQVRVLVRALEPRSAVAVDGSLRRFPGYVNLELQTPKEDRFHRVYKGVHSARQDRVVLHVYDLSVRDEGNAEVKARREYEALHRLQLHTWAPRILDSFQDAPGYAGEMFFFTLVDPAAPSIEERASDDSWGTMARLAFARNTIGALKELHDTGKGRDAMVHRSLPDFLVVTMRHDYGTLYWSMVDAMPTRRKKSIQEVAISEFKAKCLSLLDEVSKTRTPLRVTRRGKAIADVIPASSEAEERSWIGSMSDSIKIVGDIVSPVIDTETIEALKN